MGLIYNATNEAQSVKAFGNWFTFKPRQIKMLDDRLSTYLAMEKAEHGLVNLSASFEDPSFIQTDEGKQELALATAKGIKQYIDYHRSIIFNNQVSLRKDLDLAGLKVDPATYASDGEINSMEIVASYQKLENDAAQKKVDRVKELMKDVQPNKK